MRPHAQDLQQRLAPQGGNMGRRVETAPPPASAPADYSSLQHVGGSSSLRNASPPHDYHRPHPQGGEHQRGIEGQPPAQETAWQNVYRPSYHSEAQYGSMGPAGGGMTHLAPQYYMAPHIQGGGREPSNSSGGSGRDHSPPMAPPREDQRSQGFGEVPSASFGMAPPMQNGMQLPADLLMNPHLAMFNMPPGVLPLGIPPGMPPALAAGLMGQIPFPPFFQNMLNPQMIRPPISVPTPPPPHAPVQNHPPVAPAQFSPPPPVTGAHVSGPGAHVNGPPSVGVQPQPMWPVIQAGGERKMDQAERREAALSKFRQKRKDRCFAKKIRYASRKKLAEARPRIKGQFVRQKEWAAPEGGGQGEADEEELEEEEEEEDDADEEELEGQLPDISSSLNGSGDSRSAVNNGSR
jgi:hypothetical protein